MVAGEPTSAWRDVQPPLLPPVAGDQIVCFAERVVGEGLAVLWCLVVLTRSRDEALELVEASPTVLGRQRPNHRGSGVCRNVAIEHLRRNVDGSRQQLVVAQAGGHGRRLTSVTR